MCRMFGMAARSPISSHEWLIEGPRSLRALSHEHCDGWGIATHDGAWQLERGTDCAAVSERYTALAREPAALAIAHVRKATVGRTALSNTHPFQRDNFVLAHNGTITNVPALLARTSPELQTFEGDTDSERLFAFVRTHIANAGDVERGVCAAVRTLRTLGEIGSASFLFATPTELYAHRAGRSLFTLAREDATLIASEPLTAEAWIEIPEGAVVALDTYAVHALAA
ncbi:MAG: class II glutamine amidotransferase [Myxococcota bacterium]|nr:class II glutamine amidotransferase [Myxococcota bacterium]